MASNSANPEGSPATERPLLNYPSDDSGFGSDTESSSSTLVYEQEPFATFQDRVRAFVTASLWPNTAEGDIIVYRLRGGEYNRIIGLSHPSIVAAQDTLGAPEAPEGPAGPGQAPQEEEYILRLPRFDATKVENEAAFLRFVLHNTKVPVPRVVTFDRESHNVLESPFCVQNWVPGTDLLSQFPRLVHKDKLRVARDLGAILKEMLSVRSRVAGRLVFCPTADQVESPTVDPVFCVEPLVPNDALAHRDLEPLDNSGAPAEASPAALMRSICGAQNLSWLRQNTNQTLHRELLDVLSGMATKMEREGWLAASGSHHYCLAHLNLSPRNILANASGKPSSPGSSIVSAVLGWDSAVFAPPFVACAPPSWLWTEWVPSDDDSDDESETGPVPPPFSPEAMRLKDIFDESAGEEFCRFAYRTQYRLVRQLFRMALKGVRTNEDIRVMDSLVEEWEGINARQ